MQFRSPAVCGAVITVAGLCVSTASAGFTDIGGGWRAEWDSTLDPFVDIISLGVVGDAVFIQKQAEFTQGSEGGVFPSIPILFRQIEFGAVTNIVIEDEIVINSTGEDWFDFHFQLINGNDAFFNPEATMNSGGPGPIGWDINPFTQGTYGAGLKTLDLSGGLIANGDTWTPGAGADGGQLWIDVVPGEPGDPFTIFTLKETPTPGPGALGLLAIAGLAGTRRRRG